MAAATTNTGQTSTMPMMTCPPTPIALDLHVLAADMYSTATAVEAAPLAILRTPTLMLPPSPLGPTAGVPLPLRNGNINVRTMIAGAAAAVTPRITHLPLLATVVMMITIVIIVAVTAVVLQVRIGTLQLVVRRLARHLTVGYMTPMILPTLVVPESLGTRLPVKLSLTSEAGPQLSRGTVMCCTRTIVTGEAAVADLN